MIRVSRSADIVDRIKTGIQTANNDFDFLLLNSKSGAELLTYGALEALSEAGICDALVSDLSSLRAIEYSGAELSSDPAKAAAEGDFTVELLLNYIAELKTDSFAVEQDSMLALFSGVGGRVFVENEKGIPLSALTEDKDFSKKYESVLGLIKNDSQTNRAAAFTVTGISPARDGVTVLPLPKASAEAEYVTLTEAGTLTLLAAPIGVVAGVRLAKLFNCL